MTFEATIKKWGNSYAVIIPTEVVKQNQLKEHDTLVLSSVKKLDVTAVLHTARLPRRKMSGQEFKDLVRSEWQ